MKILEILSDEKYISGNKISAALGISRAAVHKQIRKLIKGGFIIKSSVKGYKLIKSVLPFKAEDVIKKFLSPTRICKKILHFRRTASTQTKLKNLAQKGEPEGTIVTANEQTSSYGRMQRKWISCSGGLWFSMLLKPKISPDCAAYISLLIALALNRILKRNYAVKTKIKWPNDILVEDKKIAGIIVEMSAEQDMVNWIVAGVGINIYNSLPEDLPQAASLGSMVKKSIDRTKIMSAFLMEFDKIYNDFCSSGFGRFCEEYNKNQEFLNENIIIDTGFGIIKGVNRGISGDGKLIIENEKGFEIIISGTLRRSV
ncbi:MAG: biotin--[acetyl-CoA-carboxylase] ligase [Endomicrobium sp.]|jgi:BirA family biotin operon repressor/biotin-[acetyl-CoA-carboxylase] ligase|nr:biotin--[acetyl-CoA-carboxylase] ligase [Endomicrobium sp.]